MVRISDDPDTANEIPFHTQGPIPPPSRHQYVVRNSDMVVERLINSHEYVSLIGPRLSGKSSMLLRQWARLQSMERYVPVYVSLSRFNNLENPMEWFGQVHREIARRTNDLLPVPPDPVINGVELYDVLRDSLTQELHGRVLVILLDHVKNTPPVVRNDFFGAVRELYVNRPTDQVLNNLVFVLAGRFVPDKLIDDPRISPFRVTEIIYMDDADLENITYLVSLLATGNRQVASNVPARIFEWTEGDVYLTHKLCAGLARDIPNGAIMLPDVDRAARRHLYEDPIFSRMWHSIQTNEDIRALIETLLEHREPVRFTLLQEHIMEAWLEGAIKKDTQGYCVLHSLVHESVFYSLQRTQSGQASRATHSYAASPSDEHAVLRGRYRLDHVLYPGLTSYVYRATDLETGDQVAVKQLKVSRELNELAWHRFQREADALKHLDHPYIVKLLDAFREGDFEYIVMEFIYGGSLFDRLNREGRLPLRQALEIVAKLADALHHAHLHDIVHRDVKPSNTMLTPEYEPRLADFGVARLNYHSRVTLPHTVIGTTPYLSPEGCQGEVLDARGDIWSLGVMLYEMLAGTLPFQGRTDDQIARAILEEAVPDIRTIRPEVPDTVVYLLDRMLAKQLSHRLAACDLVHDELHAIMRQM